jgi:hypothetical protein
MAPNSRAPFDRGRLSEFLGSWYDKQMSTALRKPRTPTELQTQGGTVFDVQPEMASTKAVRVLLQLKDILGFEPTKEVVRKGGYTNKADFVDNMTGRIEEAFNKQHSGKLSAISKPQKKEVDGHAQL